MNKYMDSDVKSILKEKEQEKADKIFDFLRSYSELIAKNYMLDDDSNVHKKVLQK